MIIDFKTRVVNELKVFAPLFQSNFVETNYLVCSSSFVNHPYYIIKANPDNFAHLIGIHVRNKESFFKKCCDGTISESDILIPYSSIKGSIRRKIIAFSSLITMFSTEFYVEEDFEKNKVVCSFAGSDNLATIGFCAPNDNHEVRPMTLLKGNELDMLKATKAELVLSKRSDSLLFDTVVFGDKTKIKDFQIEKLVSQSLLND